MSDKTGIQWTDATFNVWWGCTKVSPGCDHCYAERDAKRFAPNSVLWGEGSTRRLFGDKHWRAPLLWNDKAARAGKPYRVFCSSMADVFDKDGPDSERARLWALIEATPALTWQLLTKRVGNVLRMVPPTWRDGFPNNVHMGISVVNQEEAERDIPKLLAIAARVHFLSCEPLLGPIDLRLVRPAPLWAGDGPGAMCASFDRLGLHWIIVGGESGPYARPFHLEWAGDLVRQCKAAGVPVFVKQMGARAMVASSTGAPIRFLFSDRAGGEMHEWPVALRVRELLR